MYLEKGSNFKDHINYALSLINEHGFSRKLESKKYNNYWYISKMNKTLVPAEDETGFNKTYVSFSIYHLAFAFYIHILGCSVGLVAFFTEIIFHRLKGNI
jgi:hypothetical protein